MYICRPQYLSEPQKQKFMSFKDLGLSAYIKRTIKSEGYKAPYPIQEQAIPAILRGKDVLGIAKTGSGKTAGYVWPLLTLLRHGSSTKNRMVQALVLVPTRELAVQVQSVFHLFGNENPDTTRSMAVYGGVAINPQMKKLFGVNILVATPGRLIELAEANAVDLSGIEYLVLDEADKMLNLGFEDEMHKIFKMLPRGRQNLLFSATLSEKIEEVQKVVLHRPTIVKIAGADDTEDKPNIEQTGYFVDEETKGPLLRHIIHTQGFKQVLIFAGTSHKADNIAKKLKHNGIDATSIHGKRSQGSRTDSLTKFKNGSLRVLVATDLLSRGIDISGLPCVINYDLPRSPKDYVHRIGRTGRADAKGEAMAFVTPEDKNHFRVIQKKMGTWVTMIDSENLTLVSPPKPEKSEEA